jgi:hypothetical protein
MGKGNRERPAETERGSLQRSVMLADSNQDEEGDRWRRRRSLILWGDREAEDLESCPPWKEKRARTNNFMQTNVTTVTQCTHCLKDTPAQGSQMTVNPTDLWKKPITWLLQRKPQAQRVPLTFYQTWKEGTIQPHTRSQKIQGAGTHCLAHEASKRNSNTEMLQEREWDQHPCP